LEKSAKKQGKKKFSKKEIIKEKEKSDSKAKEKGKVITVVKLTIIERFRIMIFNFNSLIILKSN